MGVLMRMLLRGVLVVAVAVSSLGAGCSSSDDDGQAPAPTPLLDLKVKVPDCLSGRVLAPNAQTSLRVVVTDPSGAPAKATGVLFVAPDSGATGRFAASDPLGANYARVKTDDAGVAVVDFIANENAGPFLIDALLEEADAQVTFAITTTRDPVPVVTPEKARCRLEGDPAFGDPNLPERLVHGPFLLGTGAIVAPGFEGGVTPAPAVTTAGPTWFFWVDEQRHAGFGHRTRYVTVDTTREDGTPLAFPSEWWPVLTAPGAPPVSLLSPWRTNRAAGSMAKPGSVRPASLSSSAFIAPRGLHPLADPPADAKAGAILVFGGPDEAYKNDVKNMKTFFTDKLKVTNIYTKSDAAGEPASPTLAEIGAQIDKAKADGCTKIHFYVAAHGDRTGIASWINGSTPPPIGINYDALGQLFKEKIGGSGIKLDVIFVSCYSGNAIRSFDGIGVDGTMVTSADEENQSFMSPGWFNKGWGATTYFTDNLTSAWVNPNAGDVTLGGATITLENAFDYAVGGFTLNPLPGNYFYFKTSNPLKHTLIGTPDSFQVPDVAIPCPGESVAVTINAPAPPGAAPLTSTSTGTVVVADPSIVDVGAETVIFDLQTGVASKTFTAVKDGTTTYTVNAWREPLGRFTGTAAITVKKCARFVVTPITATFTQATFTTTYQLTITNPSSEPLTVEWSGPNCDSFTPTGVSAPNTSPNQLSTMSWTHRHQDVPNPCDATTDHKTITIKATIVGPSGRRVCTFLGAEDGTGPVCVSEQ